MGDVLDLDALKALTADASEGPWDAADDGLVWAPRLGDPVSGSIEMADATFIAAARTAVPALIAEVEQTRAERDRRGDELRRAHAAIHAALDCHNEGDYDVCCGQATPCETVHALRDALETPMPP